MSREKRGVSEVIGVVLLVAIVVLLAGTVGYVALGVDRGREPTPQFSKIEDYNRDTSGNGQALSIEHGSGETSETIDMRFVIEGAEVVEESSGDVLDEAVLKSDANLSDQAGEEWQVGEKVILDQTTMEKEGGGSIDPGEYINLRGATVEIVWVPENEGSSDVLFRWKGPDA